MSVRRRSANRAASNGFLNVSLMLERSKLMLEPSSGKQGNQNRFGEVGVATQILANLQRFDLADREVDDDAVGVETLRLDAGFKTAGGGRRLETTSRGAIRA